MLALFTSKRDKYLKMLINQNHDWLEQENDWEDEAGKAERLGERNANRMVILADVFGISTSEDYVASKMAKIIVQAIDIVNEGNWGKMDYEHYLFALNMSFFKDKLDWGVSAQMPWWDSKPMGDSLFFSHSTLPPEEWLEYMRAIVAFAKGECQ